MNNDVIEQLDAMNDGIHEVVSDCVCKMHDSCTSVEESIESMTAIIEVLSVQHQSAIWALIGSILDMNRSEMGFSVPHSALKETIEKCISGFSESLTENIVSSCKDAGYSNILDPNKELREEILNGNL